MARTPLARRLGEAASVAAEAATQGTSVDEVLESRAQEGRDVAFCIGGPDGLAPDVDARAELRWSLSALTLPHALARVVVAEALYRAVSIIKRHPYHRA